MQQDHQQMNTASSSSNGAFSLFNNDEMNFMNDSLSNADKFDPFTAGMPGFKVPAVLPANLGGMGSAPKGVDQGEVESNAPRWLNRGYGQDRNWQMQQLEALQAERQRYMASARPSDQSGMMASSSTLPDFSHSNPLAQNSSNGMSQQINNQYPSSMHSNYIAANANQAEGSTSSANHLGHLALQYPSSHQFPAAPQDDQQANSKKQRRSRGDVTIGGEDEQVRRGRSPNARPPWTQPPNVSNIQPGRIDALADSASMSKSKSKGSTSRKDKDDKTSLQARLAMTIDTDAPYVHSPAPKPPPKMIDLSKAELKSSSIPDHLKEAFFSSSLPRYQPHLILLRQEQLRRKEQGLSANIRKGDKKLNASRQREDSQDGVDGEKKKGVLLSTEEKKARHIFSEQKRRANIRKGYESLCELIPALRDGIDGDGSVGIDDDSGDEDDNEEGSNGGGGNGAKKGKRRRGQEMGDASISGGDRYEAKGGARSEAVILMAAVEHVRRELEKHRDLVSRKQDAQLRIAQQLGIDVSSNEAAKQS